MGNRPVLQMFAAFHFVLYLLSSFLQRSPVNSDRLSRQIALRMFVLLAPAKLYSFKKIDLPNSQQHLLFQKYLYSC